MFQFPTSQTTDYFNSEKGEDLTVSRKKKYQNIYNTFRTWYPLAVDRSALLTWNSNTGSVLALIQEETYGRHVLNKEYPTEKDQKK